MIKDLRGVALFGGSFDPPHLGHLSIVKKLLELERVSLVIIMPTWLNPFKKSSHALAQQRLKWCSIIFDIPNVKVSNFEIEKESPVYTIETWKYLKESYSLKYLVIGSDNLKNITKWKDFDILNQELTWIVATRSNKNPDVSMLKRVKILEIDVAISSSEIRVGEGLKYIDPRIYDEVIETYNIKERK